MRYLGAALTNKQEGIPLQPWSTSSFLSPLTGRDNPKDKSHWPSPGFDSEKLCAISTLAWARVMPFCNLFCKVGAIARLRWRQIALSCNSYCANTKPLLPNLRPNLLNCAINFSFCLAATMNFANAIKHNTLDPFQQALWSLFLLNSRDFYIFCPTFEEPCTINLLRSIALTK